MKNIFSIVLVLSMTAQVFAGIPTGKAGKAKSHAGKGSMKSCPGKCPYYNPAGGSPVQTRQVT